MKIIIKTILSKKSHFVIRNSFFAIQRGLTLIELLIVVAVLGVLAATILISINPIEQLHKSNDVQRKNDLAQMKRALDLYYNDNGRYPASSVDFKVVNGGTPVPWGSAWQPYMNQIPKDPVAAHIYQYYSPPSTNGQTYYLYANLERGAKDAQACNSGSVCLSISTGGAGYPAANSCGATCNFAITSPNVAP